MYTTSDNISVNSRLASLNSIHDSNMRNNGHFPACLQSSRRQNRLQTGIKKLRVWSAATLAINRLSAATAAAATAGCHPPVILKWSALTQNYGTVVFFSRCRPSHGPFTNWTRVAGCRRCGRITASATNWHRSEVGRIRHRGNA